MHPAMLLLLLLLLLPVSSLPAVHSAAVATAAVNGTGHGSTSCAPARCGGLTITYPFSLCGAQPAYCGFPALELRCNDNRAYLTRTFRQDLYRVKDIFYHNTSLVIGVETTFAGDGTCRVPGFNVSAAGLALLPLSSPLTVSATNRNLVFVYDCEVPRDVRLPRPCANRTMGAYVAGGAVPWTGPANCSSVSVPVRGFHGGTEPARDGYEGMMRDGFLLEWPAQGDCDACKLRGGECRFVEVAFQCLRPGTMPKQKIKLISLVALSAATSIIVASLVLLMYCRKRKQTCDESNIEKILNGYDSFMPRRYKYSELKKITACFKYKLGEGGYGMVYKGDLEDGRKVAVKLLKGSKGNGEEFLNEVVSIRRTSHVNIVSLLGFCLHGSKRALIYEYMANGSLEKYIYSEETKLSLGWEKLREIAMGIARGLEYLHRGCNTRIIHFDIKPHNILLDEDFCPKIADFGLAKLSHLKDSALSMAEARGTIGFIAPEVFSRGFGVVSTKSDVYSYGIMLLEMVGGRRNIIESTESSSNAYFPNCIYDRLTNDLESNGVTCETEEIARQMTLVGLWCIQTIPGNRPSISRVIEMLEKNTSELEMPPKPRLSELLEP